MKWNLSWNSCNLSLAYSGALNCDSVSFVTLSATFQRNVLLAFVYRLADRADCCVCIENTVLT